MITNLTISLVHTPLGEYGQETRLSSPDCFSLGGVQGLGTRLGKNQQRCSRLDSVTLSQPRDLPFWHVHWDYSRTPGVA